MTLVPNPPPGSTFDRWLKADRQFLAVFDSFGNEIARTELLSPDGRALQQITIPAGATLKLIRSDDV